MEKNVKDSSLSISEINQDNLPSLILQTCMEFNYPVAFWQLPGTNERQVIVEFTNDLSRGKITLDEQSTGFALSPFLNTENKETLLIRPDFHYNFKTQQLAIKKSFVQDEPLDTFIKYLKNNHASSFSGSLLPKLTASNELNGEGYYQTIVEQALRSIQDNEIKKVVLARQKELALEPNFHPVTTFLKLCKEQADSFVSLVFIPQTGIWIGASPELLVSINKARIFKTSSLAGTQKVQQGEELSNAVWTQKEIEEQALVSRYIISCFKLIRLREFEEDGPKTVQAGNLIHLKTDFLVNTNEVNYPDLGTTMLDLLHPTSAVCGMPKENALNFIKKFEKLERKFYSGFLGPVNIDQESHIFVNIRCAEIGNQKAMLYSGAGITAGSNPDKEFAETEMKMKLMETVLNSNYN